MTTTATYVPAAPMLVRTPEGSVYRRNCHGGYCVVKSPSGIMTHPEWVMMHGERVPHFGASLEYLVKHGSSLRVLRYDARWRVRRLNHYLWEVLRYFNETEVLRLAATGFRRSAGWHAVDAYLGWQDAVDALPVLYARYEGGGS